MKPARTIKQRVRLAQAGRRPGGGTRPLVVHARNYTRARVTTVTRSVRTRRTAPHRAAMLRTTFHKNFALVTYVALVL